MLSFAPPPAGPDGVRDNSSNSERRFKSMKILVLGAGLQGTACAFDLCERGKADVTLADAKPLTVPEFLKPHLDGRLRVRQLDASDPSELAGAMRGMDVVLCALPYYFNFTVAKVAVEVGAHYADLGGNTEIVREQETLHDVAADKGVSVMPDCGLAPGMVNIIAAEGIRRFDQPKSVKLFVGGLPQHPEPPLHYQVVYSLEGALDYYTTGSWIVRDGRPAEVEALTEIESVSFPDPLGTLEAFHTAGGLSTMPWHYEGAVDSMEYKTLRYPGHAHIMKAIRDLGLLDEEPVDVGGARVAPRDLFIARVDPDLRRPTSPDLVALRVVVEGLNDGVRGQVTFTLLDRYDRENGISAMMRTTGYSLAVTGLMQGSGQITDLGVRPAYQAMPYAAYVAALRERGVRIEEV